MGQDQKKDVKMDVPVLTDGLFHTKDHITNWIVDVLQKLDVEHISDFIDFLPIVFLIFICISAIFAFCFCGSSSKNFSDGNDRKQYTACESPECVRCKKYQEIRRRAMRKLYMYYESKGGIGLNRLTNALSDEFDPEDEIYKKEHLQDANVFFVPDLKGTPWWTDDRPFKCDISNLCQNFEIISKEFLAAQKLLNDKSTRNNAWTTNTTETGSWNVFYFYNQGYRIDSNCVQCPSTAKMIDNMDSFIKGCVFGNACFSVMHPGTVIEEHNGPCNIRIRCHLGLQIPKLCSITVAQKTKTWKEGSCLLFDDSFLHGTSNGSSNEKDFRVVLILDLWHPDLTKLEREVIEHIF